MIFDGNETSAIPDNSNMTREEWRFSLFIDRIRGIFKEILVKPMWIQFCLHNQEFASNDVLKNAIGLTFTEENIFRLAKEAANLNAGASLIQTLSGLNGSDGKPVFSMKFLVQKYLNMTDDDWKLNEKMKADEAKEAANNAAQNQGAPGAAPMGGDMGGGFDMGAAGGEFGGEPAPPSEPAEIPEEPPAEPAPTPEV